MRSQGLRVCSYYVGIMLINFLNERSYFGLLEGL